MPSPPPDSFARPFANLTVAGLACLLGLAAAPATAGAQTLLTWSEPAKAELEADLESPQLRTLRLLEQEWFGSELSAAPEPFESDCEYGMPDSLSSEVPPRRNTAQGEQVDLSWLSELKLPEIPVRWDERVIDYLLFFKNDPKGRALMASWLRRSELYGPMLRRVLAEHSLPADLQYVAMVESGYDPRARSYAAAQGLWQFMRRAGTHYGLRIDRWVDERLSPEKATHAAARFLGALHRRLGAWELAFAAYNMGYGGLLRSIRKYNTNDYWRLAHIEAGLPYETTLYVAKITAVAIIANNRERFGFSGLGMFAPPETREVELAPGIYLKHVASAAGVDTKTLMDLNPELRRARVPPGGDTYQLKIPAESFDHFAFRWRYRKPTVPKQHTVGFGESLQQVARRYRTTPRQLRALNDLDEDEAVYAGEILFVPGHRPRKDVAETPPAAAVPPQAFDVPGTRRVFYRTASHDTLADIARFFEVSEKDIRTWNQLSPDALLQGDMFLQLYIDPDLELSEALVLSPDEVQLLTVGSEEFFAFHEAQRGRVRIRYLCQEGDTLASIGQRFELSRGSIARINQFSSRHELSVGEPIVLYVPEDRVPVLRRKGLIAGSGSAQADEPALTSTAPSSP